MECSFSDEVEQIWYWEYNNDGGEVTKFYMDTGKRVRYNLGSKCQL